MADLTSPDVGHGALWLTLGSLTTSATRWLSGRGHNTSDPESGVDLTSRRAGVTEAHLQDRPQTGHPMAISRSSPAPQKGGGAALTKWRRRQVPSARCEGALLDYGRWEANCWVGCAGGCWSWGSGPTAAASSAPFGMFSTPSWVDSVV